MNKIKIMDKIKEFNMGAPKLMVVSHSFPKYETHQSNQLVSL